MEEIIGTDRPPGDCVIMSDLSDATSELEAMHAIATALEPLCPESRCRAMQWAIRRYELDVERKRIGATRP